MTRLRCIAAAAAAGSLIAAGSARAIDFTYLEGGLLWESTDENGALPAEGATALISSESGYGFRGAAGFDFPLLPFFVDGELIYTQPEVELTGEVADATVTQTADVDSLTARFSGGAKFELIDIVAVYGQVGYVYRTFDIDDELLSGGISISSIADLEIDSGGYEAELGARAEVTPTIELTGAVRVTDVGGLSLNQFDFDDGVFGEAGIIFDVFGPAAFRATYEFGDTDTAFIGIRAQF